MLSHRGAESIKAIRFPKILLTQPQASSALISRQLQQTRSYFLAGAKAFQSLDHYARIGDLGKSFGIGIGGGGIFGQKQKRWFRDTLRTASGSSSSTRWKSRQGKDSFARDARVMGLKSRAAFKLLEVRFHLFILIFMLWVGLMDVRAREELGLCGLLIGVSRISRSIRNIRFLKRDKLLWIWYVTFEIFCL